MSEVKPRASRVWTWALGGLGTLGTGLAACSIVCSLVVPTLLALGAGTAFVARVEGGAGFAGKVFIGAGALLLMIAAGRWRRARSRCECAERSESQGQQPIACTLDGKGIQERLGEFRAVFERAYAGGERLGDAAVRWRFRTAPGLEDELRALAAREHECCRFFRFHVRAVGDEVWWETRVDSAEARPVLEEFLALPTTLGVLQPAAPSTPPFWPGRA